MKKKRKIFYRHKKQFKRKLESVDDTNKRQRLCCGNGTMVAPQLIDQDWRELDRFTIIFGTDVDSANFSAFLYCKQLGFFNGSDTRLADEAVCAELVASATDMPKVVAEVVASFACGGYFDFSEWDHCDIMMQRFKTHSQQQLCIGEHFFERLMSSIYEKGVEQRSA